MEYLETNLRELDNFPFISSLLSDNSTPMKLKSEPPSDTNNGINPLQILHPSRSSPPSPKFNSLFHFDPHPQYHHHHHLHGSNLNSYSHEHTTSNNRFGAIEGSSSNPFSGISTTCIENPLEGSASNTNHHDHRFSSKYFSAAFGAVSLAQNESVMHGLHGARGYWGLHPDDHEIPDHAQMGAQSCVELPPLINFGEFGSSAATIRLPSEEVPCNKSSTELEFCKRLSADQKKTKRLCMRKATKVIQKKPNIIKGQWTPQEDRLLVQLVGRFGLKKWSQIAKMLNGRVGKQCRERWHNHLRPDIRKDLWSEEEDKMLIEAHKQIGNKWAEIAKWLPGRTENTIKNHWNATKRKQNSKKKSNKDSSTNIPPESSLLQDYIKSVATNTTATTSDSSQTTEKNHQYSGMDINQTVVESSEDITNCENWALLAYHRDMNVNNETDMNNNNNHLFGFGSYGFGGFCQGMPSNTSGVEDRSSMESEMPLGLEINSLMQGPYDNVKKEMDLLEMICQGKL